MTLTGKATDLGSGISYYQFSTNGNLTASSSGWISITNTTAEITQTYSVSANGTYYFYVKDAADNVTKKSVSITNIDKTAPTVSSMTEETEPIQDGLQVNLDARNNAGSGQVANKTWRNLASSTNHGILQNLEFPATNDSGWHENYLQLDGVDDFVNLEELNNDYQTLEVTFSLDKIDNVVILGNYDIGGGSIIIRNNQISCLYYINDEYQYLDSSIAPSVGTIYTVTATYDGTTIKLYVNGELEAQQSVSGTIKTPIKNTMMAIGGNPIGNAIQDGYMKGKIYSAKIYNKALTQDEVTHNYNTLYGVRKKISIKANDSLSGIVAYRFSSNANLKASSSGWTTVTRTTGTFTLTDVVVSADTKYFYAKDQAGNIKRFSTDDMNKYTITYNQNYTTETGIEGNLLYGITDTHSTKADYMQYSINNGMITVTALDNDGYGYVGAKVYLEQGKTYTFNCSTNGNWTETEAEQGDTVEGYLMLSRLLEVYIRLGNNNYYEFTVPKSGYYWLRLDVNQKGKTYTFSDISIKEKYTLDTVSKPEGSQIGSMPIAIRGDYEFDGWYTKPDGGTKVTQASIMQNNNLTLYAKWRYAPTEITYYLYGNGKGWLQDSGTGDNNMAGLTGQSLTNYGLKILLKDRRLSGNIVYRIHQQTIGWTGSTTSAGVQANGYVVDGIPSGYSPDTDDGDAKRIEAITINLTGDLYYNYSIYYKVHCQNIGWLGWAKNGENAGTTGYGYRVEAIKIRLIKRGESAPEEDTSQKAFLSK